MASETFLSYNDSLLRASDVSLLDEGNWINDTIVSFFFEYFQAELIGESGDILLISSSVVQLLKLCQVELMSCFTEAWNVKENKLILLPVNDEVSQTTAGGSHWSLLAFDCQNMSFYHLDSLNGHNVSHAKSLSEKIALHFGSSFCPSSFISLDCPQQSNGYDCGLFVIHFAKQICLHHSKQSITGMQFDKPLPSFRNDLRYEIELLKQKS